MLTVVFQSPSVIGERLCGPSRHLAITPDAIFCDGRPEPVAEFRHALWHVGGEHFTSAIVLGATTVTFQAASGAEVRRRGPFHSLRIISGYLFDTDHLIARAIGGEWHSADDDLVCDRLVLERYFKPRLHPHRILVVEDNDVERLGLTSLLRSEGYQVWEAHNGREALEQLNREAPDLILLDMGMPQVDGWEFLEQRREHPKFGAVPVVVVTGTPAVAVNLSEVDAVMRKPLHTARLLETIRAYAG